MSRESIRRVIRTWLIVTIGLFLPGLLGWLNAVTEWAKGQGSTPFPDAHGLAYLGVSAITAGVVAVINLIWNAVEDASGKGFLRTVPPVTKGQAGAVSLHHVIGALVIMLAVVAIIVITTTG